MKMRDTRGRFVKKFELPATPITLNEPEVLPEYKWFVDKYEYKFLKPKTSINGQEITTYDHSNSLNTSLLQANELFDDSSWKSLNKAAELNEAYTNSSNKLNITNDIKYFAKYNKISDPNLLVNIYNNAAQLIRDFWDTEHTYGDLGASTFNTIYSILFNSRSTGNNRSVPGFIGYDKNLDNIIGPSTWHRRMDRYQDEFNKTSPLQDRIHGIELEDGRTYYFGKESNGNIVYLEGYDPTKLLQTTPPDAVVDTSESEDGTNGDNKHGPGTLHVADIINGSNNQDTSSNTSKPFWNKNMLANSLEAFRVAGGLALNNKITNRALKVEKPLLQDPVEVHKPVYGDLRTKLIGETLAAWLNSSASRPITSDANQQLAVLLEAQAKGRLLITQGDAADDLAIRLSAEKSWQQEKENAETRNKIAMANRQALLETQKNIASIKNVRDTGNWTQIMTPLLMGWEKRLRDKYEQELTLNSLYLAKTARNRVLYSKTAKELGLTDDQFALLTRYRAGSTQFISELTTPITGTSNEDKAREKKRQENLTAWQQVMAILEQKSLEEQYKASGANIHTDIIGLGSTNSTWTPLPVPWASSIYNTNPWLVPRDKSGGTIYKAKLNKRVKDNDRTTKSIEESKKLAAKFLEQSIDLMYTYPDKKKRRKKYQAGGGLPIVNFTPVFATSERAAPTDLEDDSSKASKDLTTKDVYQLLKDMDALPNDIDQIVTKLLHFEILSKLDPSGNFDMSGIASRYMSLISEIKKAKFNREEYDHAREALKQTGGMNELAISAEGYFIGMNRKSGEFSYFTRQDIIDHTPEKEGFDLLTNQDLLYLRAQSPTAAFNHKLLNIAQGGIGMEMVTKYISNIIMGLGKDKESIEGYSRTENGQIIEGVEYLQTAMLKLLSQDILQGITLDGLYSNGYVTEDLANQIQLAMNYIYAALPENAKSLLIYKTGSVDGADAIIKSFVMSKTGVTRSFKTSMQKDPNADTSGKVDKNTGLLEKMQMDPVSMLQAGYGLKSNIIIQTSTSGLNGLQVPTISMAIVKKDGNPIGAGTLDDVAESVFAGYLDFLNASMGGVMIDDMGRDKVAVDGTALHVGYLPVDMEEYYMTGNIKPDIDMLERYNNALKEIKANNITDPEQINQIYQEYQLPIMFDENGDVLMSYKKFGIINGTAISTAFNENVDFADYITEVTDENQIQNTISKLQKGRGEKDRIDFDSKSWLDSIFGTDYDRIYAGTIFIPVNEDYFAGNSATGNYPKVGEASQIEALQQAKEKQNTYINPGQLE